MTDDPAVESADPERVEPDDAEPGSPARGPNGDPAMAHTHRRSRRKKVLTVVALLSLCIGLFALGWAIYPRRAEAPATAPPRLSVGGSSSDVDSEIWWVTYRVDQVHRGLTRVTVEAFTTNAYLPPGSYVEIELSLTGQDMAGCSPKCSIRIEPGTNFTDANAVVTELAFTSQSVGYAKAEFLVNAQGFGAASNGVTAEVAFPSTNLFGLPTLELLDLQYDIPSARSYDWSTDPPQFLGSSDAEWVDTFANGTTSSPPTLDSWTTPAQIVQGTNYGAQRRDSTFTLIVGILLGIAGGAFVAAVQEALHD